MNTSVEPEQEIWKDIPGYEGYYQVSSLGRVRGVERMVVGRHGNDRTIKGRMMVLLLNSCGYPLARLSKKNTLKAFLVHQLVAITFLGHTPRGFDKVVNHKNFNRLDNRVENLEIVSQRENTNRKHLQSSSQFTGVYWNAIGKKWRSSIMVNRKLICLGSFDDEKEASDCYQAALLAVQNNTEIIVKRARK